MALSTGCWFQTHINYDRLLIQQQCPVNGLISPCRLRGTSSLVMVAVAIGACSLQCMIMCSGWSSRLIALAKAVMLLSSLGGMSPRYG